MRATQEKDLIQIDNSNAKYCTSLCLICLMCPMCPIKRESVHAAWKGGLIFRVMGQMGHMRHMGSKHDDRYFYLLLKPLK
jgi:hypothetical protein